MSEYHNKTKSYVGNITLRVQYMKETSDFYQSVIGLSVIEEDTNTITLGSLGVPRIRLVQAKNAKTNTAGLYHIAFLLSSMASLATWLDYNIKRGTPIYGASNHLVSSAIYLQDPEGNGIEVYADTDSKSWDRSQNTIQMATLPLDIDELLTHKKDVWDKNKEVIHVGHLHLRGHNIPQQRSFYHLLGFNSTFDMASAAFLSFDGYHHHLAINGWGMNTAGKHDSDSVDIERFTIIYNNEEKLNNVLKTLQKNKIKIVEVPGGYELHDPSNIVVQLQQNE